MKTKQFNQLTELQSEIVADIVAYFNSNMPEHIEVTTIAKIVVDTIGGDLFLALEAEELKVRSDPITRGQKRTTLSIYLGGIRDDVSDSADLEPNLVIFARVTLDKVISSLKREELSPEGLEVQLRGAVRAFTTSVAKVYEAYTNKDVTGRLATHGLGMLFGDQVKHMLKEYVHKTWPIITGQEVKEKS